MEGREGLPPCSFLLRGFVLLPRVTGPQGPILAPIRLSALSHIPPVVTGLVETPRNLRDTPWLGTHPQDHHHQDHSTRLHGHHNSIKSNIAVDAGPAVSLQQTAHRCHASYSGTKLDDSSASPRLASPPAALELSHATPCIFPAGQLARAIIDSHSPRPVALFTRRHDGVFWAACHTNCQPIQRQSAGSMSLCLSASPSQPPSVKFCRRCSPADGPDRRHRQLGQCSSRCERQSLQPDVTAPILITD